MQAGSFGPSPHGDGRRRGEVVVVTPYRGEGDGNELVNTIEVKLAMPCKRPADPRGAPAAVPCLAVADGRYGDGNTRPVPMEQAFGQSDLARDN